MIGGIVKDSKLGEGKILEVLQWPASRKMGIVVELAGGKRNYVFPDAFSTNLTTEDPMVLEQIKAWHDSQTAYYAAMTPKEPPKAEKRRTKKNRPQEKVLHSSVIFAMVVVAKTISASAAFALKR